MASNARVMIKWAAIFVLPVIVGLGVAAAATGASFAAMVRGVMPVGAAWPLLAAIASWYEIRQKARAARTTTAVSRRH